MLNRLTYVNVWVDNQDDALAFYTDKLGMELREDITLPELGGFRWLTVGLPGQDVALALMEVPGAPVFDAETQAQIKSLVAKGVAGGLFFSTGRLPGLVRGAEEARRRVLAGADEAALRHRCRLSRLVRQPVPHDVRGRRQRDAGLAGYDDARLGRRSGAATGRASATAVLACTRRGRRTCSSLATTYEPSTTTRRRALRDEALDVRERREPGAEPVREADAERASSRSSRPAASPAPARRP